MHPLYSAPLLTRQDDTGLHVWQAHIAREGDVWIGWSRHGEELGQQHPLSPKSRWMFARAALVAALRVIVARSLTERT